MPKLKDLSCSIELSASQRKLQEFGTTYGDGFVETFVPVPSKPQSFSIHLASDKFIAPGISMYVFVDGVYQCNRNRQDLKLRKGSDSRTVVDFRVRQKEERRKDGSMIAREWKFEKLNTTSADNAPDVCSPNIVDNLGCIEVLVLRCTGLRNAKTASAMNVDGTSDFRSPASASDIWTRDQEGRSNYDDRIPLFGSQRFNQRPPPPVPAYHAPYADTSRNHDGPSSSQHGTYIDKHPSFTSSQREPSNLRSKPSISSDAFHYGSGPIPAGPKPGSERSFYNTKPPSIVVTNAPDVDPAWLNELVTEAVKRGVEQSRRDPVRSPQQEHFSKNPEVASEPPGAWPQSPVSPIMPSQSAAATFQDSSGMKAAKTIWGSSEDGWGEKLEGAQVNWNTESEWEGHTKAERWGAEETQSDTWNTDKTWRPRNNEGDKASQKSRWKARTNQSYSHMRDASPFTSHSHRSRHAQDGQSRKARSKSKPSSSKWHEGPTSPTVSHNQASYAESRSDSLTPWEASDSTVLPSQSQSQTHSSRDRRWSQARPSRARSTHNSRRKSSQQLQSTGRHSTTVHSRRDSSKASRPMQTPMDAVHPPVYHSQSSRTPGDMAAPAAYNTSLSPKWSAVKSEPLHNQDFGTAFIPADPFSGPNLNDDPWSNSKDDKIDSGTNWGVGSVNGKKNEGWESNSTFGNQQVNNPFSWSPGDGDWNAKKDIDTSWTAEKDSWDIDNKKLHTPNHEQKKSRDQPSSLASNIGSKPASTSKRYTSKSLSKYRQLRPTSSDVAPKSHWQFPPPANKTLPKVSEGNALPAEPLLKVSSKQASEKGIEHQVRAGKGTTYGHIVGRPTYLDTLDKPYAVFRFKYRSRDVLRGMFGDEVAYVSKPAKEKQKDELKDMPHDELVAKMLKLQMKVKEKEKEERRKAKTENTESVARDLTEKWVKQHSREASEKGKGKGGSVKTEKRKKKKVDADGWGQEDGWGDENW